MPVRVRDFEQAFCGKRLHGLPHDGPAHAEFRLQIGFLREWFVGIEVAAHNTCPQLLNDLGKKVPLADFTDGDIGEAIAHLTEAWPVRRFLDKKDVKLSYKMII